MKAALDICKALGDRNRMRIVLALQQELELCACEITELLGVSGATASRHLAILCNAGLLSSRKEGRWIHYALKKPSPETTPLLQWIRKLCESSKEWDADRKQLAVLRKAGTQAICHNQRKQRR